MTALHKRGEKISNLENENIVHIEDRGNLHVLSSQTHIQNSRAEIEQFVVVLSFRLFFSFSCSWQFVSEWKSLCRKTRKKPHSCVSCVKYKKTAVHSVLNALCAEKHFNWKCNILVCEVRLHMCARVMHYITCICKRYRTHWQINCASILFCSSVANKGTWVWSMVKHEVNWITTWKMWVK